MKKIQYLLLCSLMLLLAACEKDTVATNFAPRVTTGDATDIYRKGAVLSGSIQNTGNAATKRYGILFSELESMAEYTEHPVTDGTTDFSISFSDLNPGTTYYYSAYASSGITLAQGEVKSFTTPASNAPIFAEISLLEKNEFGCKVSASFVDEGGSAISLSGFCWTKRGEGEPTTDSSVQNAHVEGGSMSATITGLEPDSEYQLRAYAVNSDGVGYSEILVVRTNEATVPVLSSIIEKESHDFSVTVEAGITDAGSYEVTQAGFCWSTTNPTPTIEDEKKELEGSTLTMTLENLEPSTTYYIRAYATNEAGTSYSEVFTFTTADAKAPTLSAITQTASSYFSVSIEAEITDAGTFEVIKSGFCWSTTNELPTTEDNKKELAGPTLHMTLDNLESSTTYYIRAYAISEVGTSYSEVFKFTTADAKTPTLSTITKMASSDFSVSVKAEVTDEGTSEVTASGFCWSTTHSIPTIEDSKKTLEGPTLEMTLSDLAPSTTYYICAYATNGHGTSYSEVFTFTTADAKAPTLSAITQTASSYFSVSVEASITDAGTSSVTKSGFCWSTTNEIPTTGDNTKEITGPAMSMTLDELEPGTTYYIRAYAINEVGTSYSEVFTFTTADAKAPILSAITKTASTDFSVSIKAEVTDGGTSEVTQSGFCWSTTNSTPTTGDTKKELEGPALETTLENLTPNTTYYIRAYATNRFGTSYSEVFTFKTAAKDAGNGNTDINGLPVIKW